MSKKTFVILALGLFFVSLGFAQEEAAEEEVAQELESFAIYLDRGARENHYIPSGHMGDYGDIKLNTQSLSDPHSGKTCIEFVYSAKKSQGQGWSGVYWQFPADNWGNKKGGYDLTGMTKLTFWARGYKGGERIEEVKIGGINGTYPDSDIAVAGPIILTKKWQQYTIDLSGKDLSYISGGFCWATNLDANPNGATFYLDDIRYE